jgi:hypothetical protein
MVALLGSPAAIVGAVYVAVSFPVEAIVPTEAVQVTAVLLVFETVAVNVAVCAGQLSAVSFGKMLEGVPWLTLTVTGAEPPPPPHAIRSPIATRETHRPTIAKRFDIFFLPAKPSITTPASGRESGSQGERLSALRRSLSTPPLVFGPVVWMVTVTCWGDLAPWAIELKPQLTVASGKPLHANVTALTKVVPLLAVTLKVELVAVPEGTVEGLGVVGVDSTKFWATVSETLVVAVRLPDVPVTVTVAGPGVAEPLAVSVRVLVLLVLVGLKIAVTPLGRPEAANPTLPVNPPTSATVIVLVPPAPPGVIATLAGAAESVKPGVVTVRFTAWVCVMVPSVPWMLKL